VRGDATNYQDVKGLFGEKVDVVISTIGTFVPLHDPSSS